jgi:lysophospholipase L1-like esterase
MLPTKNEFTAFQRHQNNDNQIRFVNAEFERFCKEGIINFIDLYIGFLDKAGKVDKQYTNDGLPINGPGYMKWKNLLIEKECMK